MEPLSIWARIFTFLRESYSKRLKESCSGLVMGYIGYRNILHIDVSPALMATWLGVWIWMKTIFFAFSSSLATSYAALLIEKFKHKKNVKQSQKRKRKGTGGTAA